MFLELHVDHGTECNANVRSLIRILEISNWKKSNQFKIETLNLN